MKRRLPWLLVLMMALSACESGTQAPDARTDPRARAVATGFLDALISGDIAKALEYESSDGPSEADLTELHGRLVDGNFRIVGPVVFSAEAGFGGIAPGYEIGMRGLQGQMELGWKFTAFIAWESGEWRVAGYQIYASGP
jgi:hypothetical protein